MVCFIKEKWWAWTDSNCRPADYESDALTNWATGPYRGVGVNRGVEKLGIISGNGDYD